jgi:hypothetical protein
MAFAGVLSLPSKARSMAVFQRGIKEKSTYLAVSFANNSIEVRGINGGQLQWIDEEEENEGKNYSMRLAGNSASIRSERVGGMGLGRCSWRKMMNFLYRFPVRKERSMTQ